LHSKQLKGVRKELYYSPEEFSEKATVIMPQTHHKEIGKRESKKKSEGIEGIRGQIPISIKQKHVYCNSPFSFSYYSLINNLDAAAPERITDLPAR